MTEQKPTLEYGTKQPSKRPIWVSITFAVILCAAGTALLAERSAAKIARQQLIEQQKRWAEQAPIVGDLHNKYDPKFQQDPKEPAD